MSRLLFPLLWIPVLVAMAFLPSGLAQASSGTWHAEFTLDSSPPASHAAAYHPVALALRGEGRGGGGGRGGGERAGGGGDRGLRGGPSFRGGGERGLAGAPSFRGGGERSFREFSVPPRSFNQPSWNLRRPEGMGNRYLGPGIIENRRFEGDHERHEGGERREGREERHERELGRRSLFFFPYWASGGWPYYSYLYPYYYYPYDDYYGYGGPYYDYSSPSYYYYHGSPGYGYWAGYGSYDVTAVGGSWYYSDAVAAFQRGDYRDAVRLAEHAAIDAPQDPAVHVLLTQALMAAGDYRGAAMEAHAAAASGPVVDWATLYALYGNANTYTNQLRALEQYVDQNPKSPEGHFLLGYQYLILGHRQHARDELARAVQLTPGDKLAQQLLNQLGVNAHPDAEASRTATRPNTGDQGH